MNAIVVKNLSRSFGAIKAVDDISFEVRAGSVFGLLGPNGSGKTTTIRMLLGLLEPDTGSSTVLGFDSFQEGLQVRQRCGALLEHSGLYERLSAEENLQFYGRVWHMPASQRQDRIRQLLTEMGLYERRSEVVKGWSRGMRQKLAVARAMLHQPEVLFLDEPTAGLDPVAAAALRDDLEDLVKRSGVTVFLTTHNLSEAEKLCHQVAVLRTGKLVLFGSPDKLRLGSGSAYVEVVGSGFSESILNEIRSFPFAQAVTQHDQHIRVDIQNGADTSTLVPFLVSKGVTIDEIRKGKASLEDVFLSLMEEDQNAL